MIFNAADGNDFAAHLPCDSRDISIKTTLEFGTNHGESIPRIPDKMDENLDLIVAHNSGIGQVTCEMSAQADTRPEARSPDFNRWVWAGGRKRKCN